MLIIKDIGERMIELQKDAEFVPLVADLIATLMTRDEMDDARDRLFTLNIWTNNRDLPFSFESHCHFEFMQEGLRIEDDRAVMYLFYDVIEYIRVDKE